MRSAVAGRASKPAPVDDCNPVEFVGGPRDGSIGRQFVVREAEQNALTQLNAVACKIAVRTSAVETHPSSRIRVHEVREDADVPPIEIGSVVYHDAQPQAVDGDVTMGP